MKKRIHNIHQLQKKIAETKAACTEMENQLENRWEYLQANYVGMAANTMIYGTIKSPKRLAVVGGIIMGLWESKSISGFLKKSVLDFVKNIALKLGLNLAADFANNVRSNEEETPKEEPKA